MKNQKVIPPEIQDVLDRKDEIIKLGCMKPAGEHCGKECFREDVRCGCRYVERICNRINLF